MTSVTIKAFPSSEFHTTTVFFATVPGSEAYWDVIASVLSQFPALDEQGISGYTNMVTAFASPEFNITEPVDAFLGIFLLPALHPSNTSSSLEGAINKIVTDATAPYPGKFFSSVTSQS